MRVLLIGETFKRVRFDIPYGCKIKYEPHIDYSEFTGCESSWFGDSPRLVIMNLGEYTDLERKLIRLYVEKIWACDKFPRFFHTIELTDDEDYIPGFGVDSILISEDTNISELTQALIAEYKIYDDK